MPLREQSGTIQLNTKTIFRLQCLKRETDVISLREFSPDSLFVTVFTPFSLLSLQIDFSLIVHSIDAKVFSKKMALANTERLPSTSLGLFYAGLRFGVSPLN